MNAILSRTLTLFEVPASLTYFRHNQSYLVVNPEVGSSRVLDRHQFELLQRIASNDPFPLVGEDQTNNERDLALFILSRLAYYNGHKPEIKISESPLNYVYYAITDGCNLRCPYCYASSERKLAGELSNSESRALLVQIAAAMAKVVVFTGGEPMLRRDLFQLAEFAGELGLQCNIVTNGTLIKTLDIAKRVAKLFKVVTVSLDGATADEHDITRGRGTFSTTMKAIHLLNEAGVTPNINHIVTSDNVDRIESFAKLLSAIRVSSVRLMSHNKLGRGRADGRHFDWNDHIKVQHTSWTSPAAGALRTDGPKRISQCTVRGNCGMGGNEIYINSLGDVYPCKLVTEDVHLAGNVRHQPLVDMLEGPLLAGMRTSTVFGGDYHSDCEKCYVKTACGGGCRASHLSNTADLRKNSRQWCRIWRHGIISQLWIDAGVNKAELSQSHEHMTLPRLVASDDTHPAFYDWRNENDTLAQSTVHQERLVNGALN